jgi:hypothetical protein
MAPSSFFSKGLPHHVDLASELGEEEVFEGRWIEIGIDKLSAREIGMPSHDPLVANDLLTALIH